MRWKRWVMGCVSAAVVAGGVWVCSAYTQTKEGDVEIFQGANLQQITTLLEDYGVVGDGDMLFYYLKIRSAIHQYRTGKPLEYMIKQGRYHVQANHWSGLIQTMEKGPTEKGETYIVTIPEGNTVEDIANILEKENVIKKEAFLRYVDDPNVYNNLRNTYTWLPPYNKDKRHQLEGYLFAETYYLGHARTVDAIVGMMLKETDGVWNRNQDLVAKTGLSFDQVITLASIVEKESKFDEDRPKVAQVFYNRLKQGMKLQSDITAAYALGVHKTMMTYADISVQSPYNTYVVPALPIGPIDSPSRSAIRGVLLPAGDAFTDLYFYARPNGQTFYSKTLQEHNAYVQQYKKEWEALKK